MLVAESNMELKVSKVEPLANMLCLFFQPQLLASWHKNLEAEPVAGCSPASAAGLPAHLALWVSLFTESFLRWTGSTSFWVSQKSLYKRTHPELCDWHNTHKKKNLFLYRAVLPQTHNSQKLPSIHMNAQIRIIYIWLAKFHQENKPISQFIFF